MSPALRLLNTGALVICLGLLLSSCESLGWREKAPLFDDLGSSHRDIATKSEVAERYFNQGLVLTYAFNHREAIRSFREATRLDPGCLMAWWGIAYALGPNINVPMNPEDNADAYEAAQKALTLAPQAPPVEAALARAVALRYVAKAPEDRAALDTAFADSMRDVAQSFPEDADVQTLFAESLMVLSPWDYWDKQGQPRNAAVEIVSTLEPVVQAKPPHPGALHYYIHAVEASADPGRAEEAADLLGPLVPGAGHLVHMPAHIYIRVGRYNDASVANEHAAAADESYIAQCRAQGVYPAAYYPHNIHFLWASATMEGRSEVAIRAAEKLAASLPPERYEEFPFLEEFVPVPLYAYAHFGRWNSILEWEAPPKHFRFTTGMWHYARGLTFARLGELERAIPELEALAAVTRDPDMDALILLSGTKAQALLEVAELVLRAEVEGVQGHDTVAVENFEKAIEAQDALPYSEPPPWYFPIRQALGTKLLELGRAAEAEAVYRRDLEEHPNSGWSLGGLLDSLKAQERFTDAQAVSARFEEAWPLADITLGRGSSCCGSGAPPKQGGR